MKHNHTYTHTQSSLQPSQREKKISDCSRSLFSGLEVTFDFAQLSCTFFKKEFKKSSRRKRDVVLSVLVGCDPGCVQEQWHLVGSSSAGERHWMLNRSVTGVCDWLSWMKAFPRSILILLFKSIWKTTFFSVQLSECLFCWFADM